MNSINEVKNYLKTRFVEREEIIDMMFVSLVARQHLLLIGLPGTAKSALIREFASMIDGGKYFEMLLTRFSNPEELFGSVKLDELEKGVYKRNVDGKLPTAHIGFVDEIFKANSAILNSLLTMINERVYHNGDEIVQSPLMSIFGGSNEYPEENEGLEALFDRFLIRFEVEYIAENKTFFNLLKNVDNYVSKPSPVTIDEIEQLQMAAENVMIPDEVLNVLVQIREKLANEGIYPSDRRFVQSLSLLKANALLNNRASVNVSDIMILKNGLWENINQKAKVVEIVSDFAMDKVQNTIDTIQKACSSLIKQVKANPDAKIATETLGKAKDMIAELEALKVANPKRTAEIDDTIAEIVKFNSTVSELLLGSTL